MPGQPGRQVRFSRFTGHGFERLLEVICDGAPVVAIDYELARGNCDGPTALMVVNEIDDGPREGLRFVGDDDVATRGDRNPAPWSWRRPPVPWTSPEFNRVPPPIRSGNGTWPVRYPAERRPLAPSPDPGWSESCRTVGVGSVRR